MAMRLNKVNTDFGVQLKDAYFKIIRFAYNDETKECYFAGVLYVNEDARRAQVQPIDSGFICETFVLSDKTVNVVEACYNYIKEQVQVVLTKTDVEIEQHNELILSKDTGGGQPVGMLNPRFRMFEGAEDC